LFAINSDNVPRRKEGRRRRHKGRNEHGRKKETKRQINKEIRFKGGSIFTFKSTNTRPVVE
jgi:hypothetical protein